MSDTSIAEINLDAATPLNRTEAEADKGLDSGFRDAGNDSVLAQGGPAVPGENAGAEFGAEYEQSSAAIDYDAITGLFPDKEAALNCIEQLHGALAAHNPEAFVEAVEAGVQSYGLNGGDLLSLFELMPAAAGAQIEELIKGGSFAGIAGIRGSDEEKKRADYRRTAENRTRTATMIANAATDNMIEVAPGILLDEKTYNTTRDAMKAAIDEAHKTPEYAAAVAEANKGVDNAEHGTQILNQGLPPGKFRELLQAKFLEAGNSLDDFERLIYENPQAFTEIAKEVFRENDDLYQIIVEKLGEERAEAALNGHTDNLFAMILQHSMQDGAALDRSQGAMQMFDTVAQGMVRAMVTGGQVTPDEIVAMIAGPLQDDVLSALADGRVSREEFQLLSEKFDALPEAQKGFSAVLLDVLRDGSVSNIEASTLLETVQTQILQKRRGDLNESAQRVDELQQSIVDAKANLEGIQTTLNDQLSTLNAAVTAGEESKREAVDAERDAQVAKTLAKTAIEEAEDAEKNALIAQGNAEVAARDAYMTQSDLQRQEASLAAVEAELLIAKEEIVSNIARLSMRSEAYPDGVGMFDNQFDSRTFSFIASPEQNLSYWLQQQEELEEKLAENTAKIAATRENLVSEENALALAEQNLADANSSLELAVEKKDAALEDYAIASQRLDDAQRKIEEADVAIDQAQTNISATRSDINLAATELSMLEEMLASTEAEQAMAELEVRAMDATAGFMQRIPDRIESGEPVDIRFVTDLVRDVPAELIDIAAQIHSLDKNMINPIDEIIDSLDQMVEELNKNGELAPTDYDDLKIMLGEFEAAYDTIVEASANKACTVESAAAMNKINGQDISAALIDFMNAAGSGDESVPEKTVSETPVLLGQNSVEDTVTIGTETPRTTGDLSGAYLVAAAAPPVVAEQAPVVQPDLASVMKATV